MVITIRIPLLLFPSLCEELFYLYYKQNKANKMHCARCGYSFETYTNSTACTLCGSTDGTPEHSHHKPVMAIAPWESSAAANNPIDALIQSLFNSFVQPNLSF